MTIDDRLSEKYSGKVLMYTEYPPKRTWSRDFGRDGYARAWRGFFERTPEAPLMLYVHMPYCLTQCLFCTCIVEITRNYADIQRYLAVLEREVGLLARLFDELGARPNFREVHLGGGSLSSIRAKEFEELLASLGRIVDFGTLSEFSIEIDPRHVKKDEVRHYAAKGINRISFGIQDFELEVQRAVNRVQPAYLTERLLEPDIRRLFPHGVNFDIICGLPRQTAASMRKTMQKVVEMGPDRVCLNYMDMAPQWNPHQLLMPQEAIPRHRERREIFLAALDVLRAGGYVRAGFDHFAKSGDSVAKAQESGKMIWNTLGVTPGACVDVAGIGMSSISRVGECYAQNFYELERYAAAVAAGALPVFRGALLSFDDAVRREVINAIRNYFRIGFADFAARFGADFREYFGGEMPRLRELAEDGLLAFDAAGISVTEAGRQFANHAAKVFDAYSS